MPWCNPLADAGVDDMALLADPFNPNRVKLRPNKVDGNMATGFAYVDARVIEERLDDVCGNENWEDEYEVLAGDFVMCRLTLTLRDGRKVTKMDVGAPSDSPQTKHKLKGAFSDALKRVAVKFGIGRYLYTSVPNKKHGYNNQWKCFTDEAMAQFRKSLLRPEWPEITCATDKRKKVGRVAARQEAPPQEQQPIEKAQGHAVRNPEPEPQQQTAVAQGPPASKPSPTKPTTGEELYRRLLDQDRKLYEAGRARQDELLGAVSLYMGRTFQVFGAMTTWQGKAVAQAYDYAVKWVNEVPPAQGRN